MENHAGQLIGVVVNFRNLTQIRELGEQVQMAQHLAALGQMATSVAHEIRNPLNSIRGFAQILRERGVVVNLRRQRGDDVAAACGQLRLTRQTPD